MEATTTTLADSLLDDLDDLSDVVEEDENGNHSTTQKGDVTVVKTSNDNNNNNNIAPFTTLPRLLQEDSALQKHLTAIRSCPTTSTTAAATSTSSKEEREHEYQLIVQSNKHLSILAERLMEAHGALCTAYHAKFPELEELLPNPIQYTKAVRIIGNEMDLTRGVTDRLSEHNLLNSNQIITISVAGSTTSGRALTPDEQVVVDQAATCVEDIVRIQTELVDFVERRMEGLAPNICALIGPTTAAKMVGLAGGLAELSKIPACNLQVLGQTRQNATSRAGLSTATTKPHQGILAQCDLVQPPKCPRQVQVKALKMVASKLALAARCDFVNVDTGRPRTATAGLSFRHEIESKLTKWQEPDKAPVLKALPKPDLTIKKRRGGKRMRRLKERFEETTLMKQANTRAFSQQAGEYGDDSMGLTMGLLDTVDSIQGGAIRKTTEKRKMRMANTKASRKRAAQQQASASSQQASSSGLASSMVFTPVQGMELVNPDANKERVQAANRKWFGENAGFQSALPKK